MRIIDADRAIDMIDEWLDSVGTVLVGKGLSSYGELIGCIEDTPTITPTNEPLTLEFDVVDTKTGQHPDWEHIARTEDWADGLVYCDIDGIAILEDGSLILLDECGNCVPCPRDRFEIRRPQCDLYNAENGCTARSADNGTPVCECMSRKRYEYLTRAD